MKDYLIDTHAHVDMIISEEAKSFSEEKDVLSNMEKEANVHGVKKIIRINYIALI